VLIVVAGLVLVAAMVLYLVLHLPTRRGASVAREPDGAAGPPGWTSGSSRHWSRDARPTLLALLLALVSLPLVALTMGAVDTTGNHYSLATPIPATALGQWSAAASAVFVSALVAGTIGAPLVRSQKWLGGSRHSSSLLSLPLPLCRCCPRSLASTSESPSLAWTFARRQAVPTISLPGYWLTCSSFWRPGPSLGRS